MNSIDFGRIITEQPIFAGKPGTAKQRTIQSVRIHNKQDLINRIFTQLEQLKDYDEVHFAIFNDKDTHEPCRMELTSEVKL